uniref:J domain-containing protein n=1 Tax=Meloidogyne javanica TaxID=6303 RepID=A0A915MYS5_MELJA
MTTSGGFRIEKEDIEKIVRKSKYFTRGGLNAPYVDQEVKIGVDANGEGVFRTDRKYVHPQIIFAEIVAFLFNFVSCFGHMDFVALFEAGACLEVDDEGRRSLKAWDELKRVARRCLMKFHPDKAGAVGLEECQLAQKAFGYLIQEGQAGAEAYIEAMNQVNTDGYRLWDLSADPAAHEQHLSLAEAIRLYGKREPVVKDPSGGECLHCGSDEHQTRFCSNGGGSGRKDSAGNVWVGHKANFCNAPRYKDVHNETLQTRQDVENKPKAGASRSMWDEPESDDDDIGLD